MKKLEDRIAKIVDAPDVRVTLYSEKTEIGQRDFLCAEWGQKSWRITVVVPKLSPEQDPVGVASEALIRKISLVEETNAKSHR